MIVEYEKGVVCDEYENKTTYLGIIFESKYKILLEDEYLTAAQVEAKPSLNYNLRMMCDLKDLETTD